MPKRSRALVIELVADTSKFSKEMGGLDKKIAKLAGIAAAAFSAREIIDFVSSTVDAASRMAESVNAVEVATGEASSTIQRFGMSAAASMGMSKIAVNEAAVAFAGFNDQMGGDAENFTQYAQRASDFASVMNLDVSAALGIFNSTMAGSSEVIRRYGIDTNAAAVAAFAYANGIAAQGEKLTAAQKTQATYGLLMQETSKFQGDFAATSDELAGSQRILTAEWENAKIALGEGLLPVMERGMPIMIDFVQSIADVPNDLALFSSQWDKLGTSVRDGIEDMTFGLIANTDAWDANDEAMQQVLEINDSLTDSFAEGKTVMEAAATEVDRMLLGFQTMSESSLRHLQEQLGLTNQELLDLITNQENVINTALDLDDGYAANAESVKFLQQALDNELSVAMENEAEAARDLAWETMELARAENEAAEAALNLSDELSNSLNPVGRALDSYKHLQETLVRVDEDGERTAEELFELAEATLDVGAKFAGLSSENIQAAVGALSVALGVSEVAARDLLTELGLLDGKKITTTIETRYTYRNSQGGRGNIPEGADFNRSAPDVNINFNGVVGDPVEAGRMVSDVLHEYGLVRGGAF